MTDTFGETQLSFIMAQMPCDVFIKNREGIYVACSESFAQKAGYTSSADLIGLTDYDCVWKDYAALFIANDKLVITQGKSQSFHDSSLLADGHVRLMKTNKSPWRDQEGNIIGVIGSFAQLTHVSEAYDKLFDQLQEKEAVYAAEVRYLIDWYYFLSGEQLPPTMSSQHIGKKIRHYLEYMINQVPMNVFWMDREGVILGYNLSLRTAWNQELMPNRPLSRYPHVGKKLADLLPPEISEQVLANNAAVLEGDETLIFEEKMVNPNGEDKIFLSYKTPIFDDEHQKVGLMGVSIDITERKNMEEDLRHAKEKAEAAHSAKIQFLKNMQHDVRTPLSCITASIKILKKMESNPEKLEFLDGVLYSSENLLKMLTKMLEYDHIQSNERPLQYQSFKIRVLLRDLVEMFGFTTRQKGLELSVDISDDVPEDLVTDFYRFQRILLNLVNNAIKFTHEGYIRIKLSAEGKHTLRCAISDTGIGIEASKQQSIFQKYVRLVGSDQGQYQGEGIGLSIVKQFVEDLGGRIELESKLNEGSTFTVLLSLQSLPIQEVQ
ncbi:MAG: PAS domain-containing sensor histidine kinase [Gammaproteobacteria bacterium]